MFVLSILSLARGLGKRLIVEGIETPEVYDALRIMGVELGQGYEIAPPMPTDKVESWLAGRVLREPNQRPLCMLGAYASHLTVVEACRVLQRQPLAVTWGPTVNDHKDCLIGRLFSARGWQGTAFDKAHQHFHTVLPQFDTDTPRWAEAAEKFRRTMAEAISARPHEMRCERVPTPPASLRKTAPITRARPAKRRIASA